MEELEFEWDAEKARSNARKHGITFVEGATVFGDRLARLLAEPHNPRRRAPGDGGVVGRR